MLLVTSNVWGEQWSGFESLGQNSHDICSLKGRSINDVMTWAPKIHGLKPEGFKCQKAEIGAEK